MLTLAGKQQMLRSPFKEYFTVFCQGHRSNHGGKFIDVISIDNITRESEFVKERITDSFQFSNLAAASAQERCSAHMRSFVYCAITVSSVETSVVE